MAGALSSNQADLFRGGDVGVEVLQRDAAQFQEKLESKPGFHFRHGCDALLELARGDEHSVLLSVRFGGLIGGEMGIPRQNGFAEFFVAVKVGFVGGDGAV